MTPFQAMSDPIREITRESYLHFLSLVEQKINSQQTPVADLPKLMKKRELTIDLIQAIDASN